MARINIWETVVNGSGLPISGATVDVWLAGTTTDATIFAAEGGGGTLSNPVTTTNGNIPGWVDEGSYDLHVTGVGITETTKRWNAVLGGNPAKAADSITSTEIGADQVGTSEIAPGAVTSTELAADSVIAGKIAAGAISQSSDFAAGVVDSAALGANSVVAGKIAAGAISESADFAAGVVDAAAIGADQVGSSEIAAGAVGTSELADDSVTAAKLQLLAITENASVAVTLTTSFQTAAVAATPAAGTYIVFGMVQYEQTDSNDPGVFEARLSNDSIVRSEVRSLGQGNYHTSFQHVIVLSGAENCALQVRKTINAAAVDAVAGGRTRLLLFRIT